MSIVNRELTLLEKHSASPQASAIRLLALARELEAHADALAKAADYWRWKSAAKDQLEAQDDWDKFKKERGA